MHASSTTGSTRTRDHKCISSGRLNSCYVQKNCYESRTLDLQGFNEFASGKLTRLFFWADLSTPGVSMAY